MKTVSTMLLTGAAALAALAGPAAHAEPGLPEYEKTTGVSGNLNSIGSDTLNNLMALWAEAFREKYPSVNIQIEGKGSSTAPPALISGTAQLGPMSRAMKSEEIDKFVEAHGYEPTAIGVALDSLAVYVHKDNPIQSLSLVEVDGIFSQTFNKGGENITTWGQVGLTGPWAARPISLYGRNSASGTYGYFKEVALGKGDYKDSVKEQPGSASVVMGVANDLSGIGYSGIGYRTSGVKAIALGKAPGEPAYEPTYENVLSGNYPLGRMLYVYVARKPGEPLDKLTAEFLRLVLSKEGQAIVEKDGYLPLTPELVQQQLEKLN